MRPGGKRGAQAVVLLTFTTRQLPQLVDQSKHEHLAAVHLAAHSATVLAFPSKTREPSWSEQ